MLSLHFFLGASKDFQGQVKRHQKQWRKQTCTTIPPKGVPLIQLVDDLKDSWREVSKCTSRFLHLLLEFDRREAYREWGLLDTAQWLDAKCGINRVTAREKVRVARALSQLELIPNAFEEGFLSYSQVRALTRYADMDNESELLRLAECCPASELEVRLRAMENGELLNPGTMGRRRRTTA